MASDRTRATTSRDQIDGRTIISRVFEAPREVVFAAWTDAQQVQQWWGPEHFHNTVCDVDARAGGSMVIHMQAPDGSLHPMDATFETVEAPERLVFTSRALRGAEGTPNLEVRTIATFDAQSPNATAVTLQFDVLTTTQLAAGALAGMQLGWNQSLDRLNAYLAGGELGAPGVDAGTGTATEMPTHSSSETAARTIEVSRVVKAPIDLVFRTFTDPQQIGQWWGPNGFTITTQSIDIRPGGSWRFVMHDPDGTDYPNIIAFDAIDAPERVVYRNVEADGGTPAFTSTVTFALAEDGGTLVKMIAVFSSAEIRDQVAGYAIPGAEQTLGRLAIHAQDQANAQSVP